jgi:L-ribulose-5-phosphate 3-epimerase
VLLVPCRIGGMPMPQAWEFDLSFDPETCLVTRVVKGENAPFQAFIDAQNHATRRSQEQLRKILPTAAETGVIIALENVWNNLWVTPAHFAAFIKSFDSPWLRAYFDIGNHVKYALPQRWIEALGATIAKCHVKDFKLNENGQGGTWADIRDGSVDWPLVRGELDRIGYSGWLTVEGSGGLSLAERARRLDLIIAGS